MSIGYACLALGLPNSQLRSCRLQNASPDKLYSLIQNNLAALESIIDYNIDNGIELYRISSDLIPFGSSVALDLPWEKRFAEDFSRLGQKIKNSQLRVSLHPGQYTVLNSPKEDVVRRAVLDLDYHAAILDILGLDSSHKIVLHIGGGYGDKDSAKARFLKNYEQLSDAVKQRLIIENDGSIYNIEDVLEISASAGIPVVYDNLHNQTNPSPSFSTDVYWIGEAGKTWKSKDGCQKIHYSQQDPDKSVGAHSPTIELSVFLDFFQKLPDPQIDIMLEVKDKNVSALKCINALSRREIKALEKEWSLYKYLILEKSPQAYQEIRNLLKDKDDYPVLEFYQIVERVFDLDMNTAYAANAAEHVWGHFKKQATKAEALVYKKNFDKFMKDETKLPALKRQLLRLAKKYRDDYLLHSYYFYL